MLDANDKSEERQPLMRAFVAAVAFAEDTRVRLAAQAASVANAGSAGNAVSAGSAQAPLDPKREADALATQLQAATRKLARDAMAWTGAAGEPDIAAAQYAYVALLDEFLLFSSWSGAGVWETYPLEARIFGTRAAGERIPAAIEALLAQRDPAQRDLAHVYLACLTLGFRGRLRGESGALRHDQLRHALFAFSLQRDPEPDRLGASLEHTALAPREARPLTQMFPDRSRFGLFVGGGFAALVAVSQLLWLFATAPVRPALDQFEAASPAAGRPAPVSPTSTSGMVLPRARTRTAVHTPQTTDTAAVPVAVAVSLPDPDRADRADQADQVSEAHSDPARPGMRP